MPKTPIQNDEPDKVTAEQVIIIGIVLSEQQIVEMEQAYDVKPLPRNYWYETYSGMYGALGYPSYGSIPTVMQFRRKSHAP